MLKPSSLAAACLLIAVHIGFAAAPVHVWEKQELTFTSERSHANPYAEVTLWVDLLGPGFRKRVYGFWDGGTTFRVRVLATAPGKWSWKAGSEPPDTGFSGKSGSFTAVDWTEAEKQENPLRRGIPRATINHHEQDRIGCAPIQGSFDSAVQLAQLR